jgi:hypothetical protein
MELIIFGGSSLLHRNSVILEKEVESVPAERPKLIFEIRRDKDLGVPVSIVAGPAML